MQDSASDHDHPQQSSPAGPDVPAADAQGAAQAGQAEAAEVPPGTAGDMPQESAGRLNCL
ncbi:MAG TPA: hypothetical protein VMV92_35555 [Streptosporangiaceae bacterium]|nr:hypothetical protein [Streptosporangiaceae bacterium]